MQTVAPTISVITICYNAGHALRHTVASVCSQTYPHVEYIVVDGVSTDRSLETINDYYPLISRIISEPDNGIYDAMNKGLSIASGDYVCFMNAGDSFASRDTLSDALGGITGELPDIIYGETDIVDSEYRYVRHRRLRAPEQLKYESFRHGMVVCHQSFYARRSIAPLYDTQYQFSADVDWCLHILRRAQHIHNTHLTLTHYLEEGTTTRNHCASLRERFRIMRRHYGFIPTLTSHIYFGLRMPFVR